MSEITRLITESPGSSGLECVAYVGALENGHEAESRPGPARLHWPAWFHLWPHRKTPSGGFRQNDRAELAKRLEAYVQENRTRNWGQALRLGFRHWEGSGNSADLYRPDELSPWERVANSPGLLEFRADRTETGGAAGEWDIYGCAKRNAKGGCITNSRSPTPYLEHAGWFFTAGSFTEFPNEPLQRAF